MIQPVHVQTNFYQVQVLIRTDDDGNLDFTYIPDKVNIDTSNAVISYQLVEAPADTTFWGMQILPANQDAFGAPQISGNGYMLSINDVNGNKEPNVYSVSLMLSQPGNGILLSDPQIINRPG
ncbi:hypothetical protein HH212_19595 [Massilia forsythiae]|uniref:Uncharacterized protein n=1 Tax=Massilia forsythiae TaxID=2728020 RepID=A0A7Z2VZG5_9BURK|nr:hypothetical protein [Massilia forsythiae]QJE01950.1 hypothetical protein HH212_19595 [Massilia forsythiae]